MLEQKFKQRYLDSLSYYKYFYDDVREYGSPDSPRRVFYFIPGFSGVAGQVRFIFPNLHALYGNDFYVQCCHLDAFSASKPIWEKYTTANLDARRAVIVADIKHLLDRHGEVVILASSNGFYDFVYAFDELASAVAEGRLKLLWGPARRTISTTACGNPYSLASTALFMAAIAGLPIPTTTC